MVRAWARRSAGRARGLQPRGHRFESCRAHHAHPLTCTGRTYNVAARLVCHSFLRAVQEDSFVTESASQKYAFFHGKVVPLEEARISVMTHAFNYGTGVFEG